MAARPDDRPAESEAFAPRPRRNFYGRKLITEDERNELEEAAELEGLQDEIAMLRVRLRAALSDPNQDPALLLKALDLLVKAVAAQYRLSPRASKDLGERFAAALNSVGDQLFPGGR